MNITVRKFLFPLAILLAIFVFSSRKTLFGPVNPIENIPETVASTGKISNKKDVSACLQLLQQNLTAATNKDIDTYIETLVISAQKETYTEMAQFFETFDLRHDLLSFEVIKQEDTSMLVAARQKTVSVTESEYRNHITQAHHTFVKENESWKIQETVMTDTQFID